MSNISTIAAAVLTLAIGYAFVYPSFGDLKNLLDEKQKYLDSLDTIGDIENRKNELVAKYNEVPEADRKNIDVALPSSLDFVKLTSQIDAVASKYGILVGTFSSKDTEPTTGTSIENTTAVKPYNSSVVGFSFSTSYETFRAFLDDLEKSLRILDVRSVNLEAKENGIYTFNVEFETYWLE